MAPSAYLLSGLAVWLEYLLPGLQRLGWDVTLGLVSGPRHHRPEPYLDVYPFSPIELVHCQCSTPEGRRSAVRRAIQAIEPKIVLTVNIPDAVVATAREKSAGQDVRVVMSCHGIHSDLFTDMSQMSQSLDAVVCTSTLACRLAEDIGQIPAERCFHATCGTIVPKCLPKNRPDNQQRLTIGYAGRVEQWQKRIFDLVSIAQRLRKSGQDFRMIVAGDGAERADLQNAVQQHRLDDNFEFTGFLPPDQFKHCVLNRVDALIVMSDWETGPIVAWEAMAAGVPVVTSKFLGCRLEKRLRHMENCLIFPVGDTQAAANHLLRLHRDDKLRQAIRRQAFRDVRKDLSRQASIARWDAALSQVADRDPSLVIVSEQRSAVPSGRLNRLLGIRTAAIVRRMLHRMPPDSGPGGEWPHTIAGKVMDEESFLTVAGRLDAGG